MTKAFRIICATIVCSLACPFFTASRTCAQQANSTAAPDGSYLGFLDGVKHGSVVYSRGENYELKCDIYVPNGEGPFPAILAIHGGAWRSGTKLHMLRHAFKFCEYGFVVVCINYRHAPEFPFPAQVRDGFEALQFMRDQAETYQIDLENVFGFGYSAGGHLISLMATTTEKDWFAEQELSSKTQTCPTLKAVVAGGAPCDFDWVHEKSTSLKYWLSVTKAEDAEIYKRAAPICHVSAASPPFFLFYGKDDRIVPTGCSTRMAAALENHSVSCEVTELPGCGHIEAFSQLKIVDQANEFFRKQMATDEKADSASPSR